jgi:hypothetical protein
MTARLYGLWVLSVILALTLAFLTPGRLTLLPVTADASELMRRLDSFPNQHAPRVTGFPGRFGFG